jgi:hemerythrin-like domain-containing protein
VRSPTRTVEDDNDEGVTMSNTLDETEQTAGTTAPTPGVDLYREVHKGLRRALSEVVDVMGALDVADAEAVASLRARFADLDMMLTTHHAHEEIGRLGELIAEHVDADIARSIQDAHDWSDAALADLRNRVARLQSDHDAAALYDAAVEFVAGYLAHMNDEEHVVMPALNAGADPEELGRIVMQIRMSVPPPEMCTFLRYMLPAMNPDERTTTLGGMKMGAPPEVFDMFWSSAERSLTKRDLAAVEASIA